MSDNTSKKQYTPPRVIAYGHVKDVVQGGGGKKSDAGGTPPGGASRQQGCWIAEQIYGVDDLRTFVLRTWMNGVYAVRGRGWRFVALYRRFGIQTARLIASGYLPRRPFRLVFDRLLPHALDASFVAVAAARQPGA